MTSLFTMSEKLDIYNEHLAGETKAQLARDYNVSSRTIGRVIDEVSKNYKVNPISGHTQKDYDDTDYDGEDLEYEDDEHIMLDTAVVSEPRVLKHHVIATEDSITIHKIYSDGTRESAFVSSNTNSSKYFVALQSLKDNGVSEENLAKVFSYIDEAEQFVRFTKHGLSIDRNRGTVKYDNVEFRGRLLDMLLNTNDTTEEFTSISNFATRLAKNPSNRAVTQLYDFVEKVGIQITRDGMVECYKKVRSDFKDIYTGTIDNSIGSVVSVSRNMVDEDYTRTCSYGLHVCSKDYLPHYGSSEGDVILKVLVDPADFVAIPPDYNNAKARVCEYKVISIATDVDDLR